MARKRRIRIKKLKCQVKDCQIILRKKKPTYQQKKKKKKYQNKLISVAIGNKHPEIDINDHEIQNFLLIFSLLLEAESDKISNGEDAEDEIPDILITIAAKLLQFCTIQTH